MGEMAKKRSERAKELAAGLKEAMARFTPKQRERIERDRREGTCEICGKKETQRTKKQLSRDHHQVGKRYRGNLCGRCNSVIGMIDEKPELAEAIATYLRRNPIIYDDEMSPVFPDED